jgi:molecular chaperone GrpE
MMDTHNDLPQEGEATALTGEGAPKEAAELKPEELIAQLEGRLEELMRERAALYDQLLRRQADFENYRKRIEREREEIYQRAQVEILRELLPVFDNFDRALLSLEHSEADAETLRHGIELIHRQLNAALSKMGLEPLESIGKPFDPHLHEAVAIEPSEQHGENIIIEEFQRGYKLGNLLIRPAKVKVAAAPERTPEER